MKNCWNMLKPGFRCLIIYVCHNDENSEKKLDLRYSITLDNRLDKIIKKHAIIIVSILITDREKNSTMSFVVLFPIKKYMTLCIPRI